MIILGIETSCDETSAAVLQKTDDRVTILSNVVASSADLQAKYGGVIPEQAAREQLKSIIPVIQEALNQAFPKGRLPRRFAPRNDGDGIDAIAVTYGPGLIGSLLVGVETAKVLATVWKKPLIPVNHLLGHFYANWISAPVIPSASEESQDSNLEIATSLVSLAPRNDKINIPQFPTIGLLVSGGHTDLILFRNHNKYEHLGGTRDDAAGECFDKCARLLNLGYPGGPQIAKLAAKGNPQAFNLPRPMINSKDFDFSFSGLKTAVANLIKETPAVIPTNAGIQINNSGSELDPRLCGDDRKNVADLAASIEQAIVDVLVAKTIKAAQTHQVNQIIVAGGVAANQSLIRNFKFKISNFKLKAQLFVPPPELCTDNAAMIAVAAFYNYKPIDPLKLQANPNLFLT